MHIDEAIKSAKKSIDKFYENWLESNKNNSEEYPMELEDDNSGLWFEFITDAILSGEDYE